MARKATKPPQDPRPLKSIMEDLERAVNRQESVNEKHEHAKGDLETAVANKKETDSRVRALKKELDAALRGKA